MQIQIVSGIYTDGSADIQVSYPRNLMPIPVSNGVSDGYLRPAYGLATFASAPGIGRGGIAWNGSHYRISGEKLVKVNPSGTVTELADIPGTDLVSLDYSFDRLAIAADGKLFYWDGSLTEVIDADLGDVVDMLWVDGYFMTTDGSYLVVTELNDPTAVNPLKYGSSEVDPDPIVALKKIRGEVSAVNRYTIETFQNIGGDLFPFQRIDGAVIDRGAIGTRAVCVFNDALAFVGSGRNEAIGIYIGGNGQSVKISDRTIDSILSGYAEEVLSQCLLESVIDESNQLLKFHLPDQTLVHDAAASAAMQKKIWFFEGGGSLGNEQYPGQNFTYFNGAWYCDRKDAAEVGIVDKSIGSFFGDHVGWEFTTPIVYNGGAGAIFHQLELVGATGRAALGDDPVIWSSYSVDGMTWSMEKPAKCGKFGERTRRMVWFRNGMMRNFRLQKFRGLSDCQTSFMRLEASIEALYA